MDFSLLLGIKWVVTAAVIGGITQYGRSIFRVIKPEWKRSEPYWFRKLVLPLLPISLGLLSAVPQSLYEHSEGVVRAMWGLLAGFAAAWVYDRVHDAIKDKR